MSKPEHPASKIHPALHKMVEAVLAYRPKPKSAPAKKRARVRKKIEKERG
jgi:hypothetical protein